ncbi:MAG: hypothetical protein PHV39_09150, partial [Methanomicrobium sp.]|nr:hypothetical protein [Methanomicrobium sp.]
MAGFLKKLFSKEGDMPHVMEYTDIAVFLDKSEKEDADKVEEVSNLSKPEVMAAIGDLKNKADSLSKAKISDDAEISPRVRTVVEKSLPGFSASLIKALPDSLPADPEEYYKTLVEVVQSIGKCLSGQGKYIHAVFPAEMKDIKTSLGVIGREINTLNEKIKPAMQNKEKISAVRTALNRSESLYSEYISSLDEIQKIESLISSNKKEL